MVAVNELFTLLKEYTSFAFLYDFLNSYILGTHSQFLESWKTEKPEYTLKNDLYDTIPNISVVIKIILVLPISVARGEKILI